MPWHTRLTAAHVGTKVMMFEHKEIPVAQGLRHLFSDRMQAEKEATARERFLEYEAEALLG